MEERQTRIIVVSGSHKKVGKTLLVERLLPFLGNAAAVKISTMPPHANDETRPDSDTSRYLAAGAAEALFIQGSRDDAVDLAGRMIDSGRFDTICFETNRFSEIIDADLRFFVKGTGDPKDNAEACETRADILVDGLSPKR